MSHDINTTSVFDNLDETPDRGLPSTVQLEIELALQFQAQNVPLEALAHWQKALRNSETVDAFSTRHLWLLRRCADASTACQVEIEQTLELRKLAYELCKKINGKDANSTFWCGNELGKTLFRARMFEEALTIYRALSVSTYCHSTAELKSQNTLKIAQCLCKLGRHSEALPLARELVEVYCELYGVVHKTTLYAYDLLADCLFRLRMFAQALPVMLTASTVCVSVWGKDDTSALERNKNIGKCCTEIGDYELATHYWNRAIGLAVTKLGTDHPVTRYCRSMRSLCKKRLQNKSSSPVAEPAVLLAPNT